MLGSRATAGWRRAWWVLLASGLLSLGVFVWPLSSAAALDVWLITNHNRVLVIRTVERTPVQTVYIRHDPVPDAYAHDFGDLAFVGDDLYGISMPLGSHALLYHIDLNTGALTPIAPPLPFEWGNSLEYHPRLERMWTTGALESYSPYRLVPGFYVFDGTDPSTVRMWYDMRGDYPKGGFGADFAFIQSHVYAIWGEFEYIGGRWIAKHYLLRFTIDDDGNPLAYENLGQTEPVIGEHIWGLATDGQTLYASSPTALYRVDTSGPTASYTLLVRYDLEPDEKVNGATVRWADASLAVVGPASCQVGEECTLTWTLANAGPASTGALEAQLTWPADWTVVAAKPAVGSFDPTTGLWRVPNLAPGEQRTLILTLRPAHEGSASVQGDIRIMASADIDSLPSVGPDQDDYADARPDDDEAVWTLTIVPPPARLPETGFPMAAAALRPLRAGLGRDDDARAAWRVTIPRLGLETAVWAAPRQGDSWDVAWLGQSLGWLQGTAWPGQVGNAVLTGHVWLTEGIPGPLAGLGTLRYDDAVLVTAWGITYEYRVRARFAVAPGAVTSVLTPPTPRYAWLTLLTCDQYQPERQTYARRWVVQAVLVAQRPGVQP
ncbi:MAG: sortase [Chloroflexi bacterium]|nr:sortase [Chloroflexota bacterium]